MTAWRHGAGWRLGVFAGLILAGAGAGLIAGTVTTSDARLRAAYGAAGGVAGLAGAMVADQAVARRDRRADARRLRAEILGEVVSELPEHPGVFAYLLATSAIAPFRGRHADLKRLREWLDDPASSPVAIVTGQAGVGKSRLAAQFASQLPPDWVAGWLHLGRGGEAVTAAQACGDATLILVDDADERSDVTDLLTSLAASEPGDIPVRVVLITRTAGLLARLERALPDRPRLVLAGTPDIPVGPFGGSEDYARWFTEAVTAYARAARTPPPDLPPGASGWVYNPSEPILTLQAQALLTVLESQRKRPMSRTTQPPPFSQVAEALFRHEEHRWHAAAQAPETRLPDFSGTDQAAAIAALLIASPADLSSATSALRRLPVLADASAERVTKIARWAASLYPAEPTWPFRIKPDMLAAWLLVSQLTSNPDLAALHVDLTPEQAALLLMLLAAAADHLPHARRIFTDIITTDAAHRIGAGIRAAQTATTGRHSLDIELASLITASAWTTAEIEAIQAELAHGLPRTAAAIAAAAVTNARIKEDPATLAWALSYLAVSLRDLGRHHDALTAQEEALSLYRPLAADNPARLPDLARSLTSLGISLRDLGRHHDALTAHEEALSLYRPLAADNPARLPDLAHSLTSLGISLSDLGRHHDALTADKEALSLYRPLAADNPARLPYLASSLNNLGISLRDLGRHHDALTAHEEALSLYRLLAADNPARLPDLARSLTSLGISLSDLGRHHDALTAHEEALSLRRLLAADNPARLPDLARSLTSLGISLRDLGRHHDALTAHEEALSLYRPLAADNPARLPDTAHSLNNLGISLSDLGRHHDALTAQEEALSLYRLLAADNPARLPDLAHSLNNLGASLRDLGRHHDALTAHEEALSLYRPLAADNPARLPDLARSLNSLGISLSDLGRHHDALTADEEAVGLWREAAQLNPDIYRERYLRAQAEYRRELSRLGRESEALQFGLDHKDLAHEPSPE